MPLGFFTAAIDSALISALQWGILPPLGDQAVALITRRVSRSPMLAWITRWCARSLRPRTGRRAARSFQEPYP